MKHKTAELEGALLDAAVAKAETGFSDTPGTFKPSTWWDDGGPIIERERIGLDGSEFDWCAFYGPRDKAGQNWYGPMTRGPTPLIAAMRAFVASKFGEEVELP